MKTLFWFLVGVGALFMALPFLALIADRMQAEPGQAYLIFCFIGVISLFVALLLINHYPQRWQERIEEEREAAHQQRMRRYYD